MPRPIFKVPREKENSSARSNLTNLLKGQKSKKTTGPADKEQLNKLLRKQRPKAYLEAIAQLDAGGHAHNQDQLARIIESIMEAYPELAMYSPWDELLGIVAKCYIAPEYDVHTLDMGGAVVSHYKTWEKLPGGLEKARVLAASGYYACVEVYRDALRCVAADGRVSVVSD